ncbi:hypothetical protein [Vacuolonema iberomarrocanum]|uniref:hypothetical protein n=1 Tax=Vacuolonema iberomarrocanum TaxID=3454632 RepID=UPI0019EC68E2|nr:hypothetical protein [filamentous cyanobacterium LEGE 07170]
MKIYQENLFAGQFSKSDTQEDKPIDINGKVIFCSNGEVLLRTSQKLYNAVQSKMASESVLIHGEQDDGLSIEEISSIGDTTLIEQCSIVRPAYKGKYKIQREIEREKILKIRATVSPDTSIEPDILLQEVYLEGEDKLTSMEHSVKTVYGLVAFAPLHHIQMSIGQENGVLRLEKVNDNYKNVLEANVVSELSIFSCNLSIEEQENLAYFLIFMISFASGRNIYEAYQRSELRNGDILKITEYWRGSRSRAVAKGFITVIQAPHLELFLEQLIRKRFNLEEYRSSLLLSLSWYLETFESKILATDFVLLCTALESLNEEFKEIQRTRSNRLLSKTKYRAVKKAIFQCIDQEGSDLKGEDTSQKYEIFKTKVHSFFDSGSLNMIGNLGANLQNMLEYFEVKYEDLFPEFDFIKIRNNVIHRGTHEFDEMFDVYFRLENLYIRLILSIVKYDGNYMEHNGTGLICRTIPFTK